MGCPIARSTGYCVRYHLGSLAFGSLLIALMKLVRLLFSYLERKLKGAGTDCCGMIKCLTCFCKCCLYCFEKFLQAVCSNAYIEIGNSYFLHIISCDSSFHLVIIFFPLMNSNLWRKLLLVSWTGFQDVSQQCSTCRRYQFGG